jgi:VWFA-related protein
MQTFSVSAYRPVLLFLALAVCLTTSPPCPAQTSGGQASGPQVFGEGLKRYERNAGKTPPGAQDARDAGGQPEEVVRVNTLLTLLDVTVTDPGTGRFVEGLTKDDFVVVEDGAAQQLDTLTKGDDAARMPRSIVLIIDWSGSLLPYLDESIKAARALVDRLAPTDEMAVVTDDVKLVVGFTRDKKQLKSALDSLGKSAKRGWRGRSKQFSALLATLKDLIDVEKKRPVVIFQTDGDESYNLQDPPREGSNVAGVYYMSDIYAEVQRSRVKIYTLIPGEKLTGASEAELVERGRRMVRGYNEAYGQYYKQYGVRRDYEQPPDEIVLLIAGRRARDQEAAARVADISGGWASFFERPEQAAEVYARILSDINQQYVIGYYPTNRERDGRLRRVRVEVRGHPEYVVRGRQSYYALPQ